MSERHYGPINTVCNLKAIIRKEGGLRPGYGKIAYLAQVLLDSLEEVAELERSGVPFLETRLQDLLLLHRKVMKIKEMKEQEYQGKPKTSLKPHSYFLSIQRRRSGRR